MKRQSLEICDELGGIWLADGDCGACPEGLAEDIDNDGDLDLVTTEENTGWLARGAGVLWYENRPARQDRCPAD